MLHNSDRCIQDIVQHHRERLFDELYRVYGDYPKSPFSSELADESEKQWVHSFGLVPTPERKKAHQKIGSGRCANMSYPKSDWHTIDLGGKSISWLFLWDDVYGENVIQSSDLQRVYNSFLEVIRTGLVPENATAFHISLLSLRKSFLELANLSWLQRFHDSLESYFDGCRMEDEVRRGVAKMETLAEYAILRTQSIGILPVLDLIELDTDIHYDEMFHANPKLKRARELLVLCMAITNDLLSLKKEFQDNEQINIFRVIAKDFKNELSVQAVEEAIAFHNAVLRDFLGIKAEFQERDPHSNASKYLERVHLWGVGCFHWMATTPRYVDV